ncbi:MAG TPA: 50S ribosomal protein L29 [Acidobacteriaceae bacterium]|jgi:large subunit ribosomal protein L29|nr:50S ribosomal protein L29 [Acidobacteriaceae bacterium]
MDIEKIRNLGPEELRQQERQASEQLFRLKFQMKLGQNEGVKKLRELRKEIARIRTIERERELAAPRDSAQKEKPADRGPQKTKAARKGLAKQ